MEGMLAIAIIIIIAYLIWKFIAEIINPTNLHGPRIYPIVGTIELVRNRERFLEWATDYLLKAPGNTITLKKPLDEPFKITANVSIVEHILKTNFENYPKGDLIYTTLYDLLGDGIFNVNAELWKIQRKLASFEFTTRSLQDYLMDSIHDNVENRLLPTIRSVCDSGKSVDLQDVFLRFAFDNICKLAFGVDPMCLDPSFPEVKFAKAFDEATWLSFLRFSSVIPLVWKVKRLLNIGSERRLKEALVVVNEFAEMVIKNRKWTGYSGNQDLLSRFMNVKGEQFSDKFLRDIIISFVLAGRDTTSVSLAWLFWLLSKNPHVEQKIIEEVEKVASKGGDPNTGHFRGRKVCFSYNELREMHYLHAAISESIRLYPAVPFDTKVARASDALPDGTLMKKNMRITYWIYGMGRMESLWGKDCLEYKPERWLASDGSFVNESPYKFSAFQAGPRVCLGKDMAMLQMKSIVAALVSSFKFEMVFSEEPRYKLNITLPMRDGLHVIPKAR